MTDKERVVMIIGILENHDVPVITAHHLADGMSIPVEEAEGVLDGLVEDGELEQWKGKTDTKAYAIPENN